MNLSFLLLIVYSAALVGLGLWISRFVRDSSAFFVAGRSLKAPLLFATVLASNIGAGSTVGAAGLAYTDGISAWWWNGASAIGSLVLAFWIGPKIWKLASTHNFYTAGDYLEFRYSAAVRGVIASLIWLGTLAILAGQLMAGAAVLNIVVGLPRWAGTAASAAVMTIYFVAGGLLSSAWVNAVQLVVLIVGLLLALSIGLAAVGGLDVVIQGASAPPHFNQFWYIIRPRIGVDAAHFDGARVHHLARSATKSLWRGQSARNPSRAGLAGRGAGALRVCSSVAGHDGTCLQPEHHAPEPGSSNAAGGAASALAWSAGLAAIFSAEVSTCDAILFMLATSLSKDLYNRFVRPEATDRQVLNVARWAAVAGGVGGVVLALLLQTVQQALDIFYALLTVSLMVPIVGGLYVRRASTVHAFSAIIAGVTTLIAFRTVFVATSRWLDPTLWGLVAAVVAFALTLALVPGRSPTLSP